MKTKVLSYVLAFTACTFCLTSCGSQKKETTASDGQGKLVVAYVTSGSKVMPDPRLMTHINYAFGHVNEGFNGVVVQHEERLREIVRLKEQKPELKVMLSVGGWGSGRFSEMAASDETRLSFAADCRRVVDEFGLDGIDIDWEYPTSSASGISSLPEDTDNFTLLMRDIRAAIGSDRLLTLASICSAQYIDFRAILPYIDFVNVMAYDMERAPRLHSALYASERSGENTADRSVKAHLEAGVPASMIVLGMPFYGRGIREYHDYQDFKDVPRTSDSLVVCWDSLALVPYLTDLEGRVVLGYENPRSLALKCQYILDNDLLGGMYWEYACDNDSSELRRTVADALL